MDTVGLVDDRNINLWEALNTTYEITIQREKRDTYAAFTQNGKATIYVPLDKRDPASFTHELLHIYLKTKEVYIGGALKLFVTQDPTLSKILSENLLEQIGNCLEHVKMLPKFLEMGFKSQDFISDYSVNKLNQQEIRALKKHFKTRALFKKYYNSSAIDLYIGKYFSARACPNKLFNYENGLQELKGIDIELFQILETFNRDWDKYDYNDRDPVTRDYHDFLSDFVNGLIKWTSNKTIV